ncbi:MAG TPA: hypothetical protein VJ994_08790 [Paracoccaceae bacterium]|nr:hypothetical protein [Paracoccaceae bacterium]
MSTVEIRDECIRLKHVEGDDGLRDRLDALPEGALAVLKIGRETSTWRRMRQGANARPTSGLRPACDASRAWWKARMYPARKGERLPISEVEA